MAQKHQWCVRIVQYPGKPRSIANQLLPGMWVEQLRHLGVLQRIQDWNGKEDGSEVFEFFCPHRNIDTHMWAGHEAARMQSFGINAAAAPIWKG